MHVVDHEYDYLIHPPAHLVYLTPTLNLVKLQVCDVTRVQCSSHTLCMSCILSLIHSWYMLYPNI